MAKPDKCITPQDAKQLFTHWSNTRGEALRNHLGEEDTCEFTLSISELRQYLDYVESESKDRGISNPGVRLYFGAYNTTKSDKTTFFIAPTTGDDKDAENNYEIDPMNSQSGGWPPKQYNP
ncbi:hypothetical protein [uncultured Dokdonia sp.]|uniref:hypothetical protein n=1 Tax=uncultured Dokdonia sp. TaxID=575653 RepID=UPI00262B7218|nr:hypothetical protein [uncultured Dokdonia sp.]